jgi:hypothetical protein
LFSGTVRIVAEPTTCQHHIQAKHYVCVSQVMITIVLTFSSETIPQTGEKNQFTSKFPNDVRERKKAAEEKTASQSTLDPYLWDCPVKEKVIPYTNTLFREAVIEWLIATDQVIHYQSESNMCLTIDTSAHPSI